MKLFLQSPTDYYFPRLSKALVGCALGMLIAVPVLLLGVPLGWWAYTAILSPEAVRARYFPAPALSPEPAAPLSLEQRVYYEQRLAEIQRVVAEREAFRARPVPPATAAPGADWMRGLWPPQGHP